MEKVSIAEFYAGRSVFITGATGFLGKVLLEKLLRSCPAIQRIYVLIRPKRSLSVDARLSELLKSRLFDGIRESRAGFRDKVVPVAGDVLQPGLGLSEKDVERLVSDVTVVFHSAATVKFDESLKCMDEDVVNTLTASLIGARPNTYTFTKAVAESLLVEQRRGIPCAIVRPSVVGASFREPVEGWVDNFNGPSGILAAIGKGVLRTMMVNSDAIADLIPVDLVANMIIAIGWRTAVDNRSNEVQVYNCTTKKSNQMTWGLIERASREFFLQIPLDSTIRFPDPVITNSRLVYKLKNWYDQLLPAWCIDIWLKLTGKQPAADETGLMHSLVRFHYRLWKSVQCLEYFTTRQWTFTTDRLAALYDRMSAADRQEFNFDTTQIDWPTYMHNYCLGVKLYALNESLHNLAQAKKTLRRLWFRHFAKQCMLLASGLIFFLRQPHARRFIKSILTFCQRILGTLQTLTVSLLCLRPGVIGATPSKLSTISVA